MSIREAIFSHCGKTYRAIFEKYSVRIANPEVNRWRTGRTKTTLSVREIKDGDDLVLAVGFLHGNGNCTNMQFWGKRPAEADGILRAAAATERSAAWSTRLHATECCKGSRGKLCERCQRANRLLAMVPKKSQEDAEL